MIRQELMDNIQELKNKLEAVIDIKDCGIDRLEMVKEAYLSATKLETMVADELESQRQEQSEYIVDEDYGVEHDERLDSLMYLLFSKPILVTPKFADDFKKFQNYCKHHNVKPSNGKVLNEYFKERGV